MKKLNKQFISEIDQKLDEFNRTHKKSASQQAEIEKYRKIHELRDNSNVNEEANDALI